MKFGLDKFLQNVELKLGGRTAIFAVGEGAMLVALWLLLRDYSAHVVFSIVGSAIMLVGIVGFLLLGLSGRTRPDEVPAKSFTNIEQLGISIVHGIGSHKEMLQVMRTVIGMRRLPPPSYIAQGSADDARNYKQLTPEQSNAIVEQVEQGVEKLLSTALQDAVQSKQPQIGEAVAVEKAEELPIIKGKTLAP